MKYLFYFIISATTIIPLSCQPNNGELEYEVKRHYNGANIYIHHYFYLETSDHYDTTQLKTLVDKFDSEYRQEIKQRSIYFLHNNKYYGHFVSSTYKKEKTIRMIEFINAEGETKIDRRKIKNCDSSMEGYIDAWSGMGTHNKLNYCLREVKPNKYRINSYIPESYGYIYKDEDRDYYTHFKKYGDSSKTSYYFYWSNPYNDTPYHNIYYVNDYGDLIVKDERENGVLSVCKRLNTEN